MIPHALILSFVLAALPLSPLAPRAAQAGSNASVATASTDSSAGQGAGAASRDTEPAKQDPAPKPDDERPQLGGGPPKPPAVGGLGSRTSRAPLIASDGKPVEPGRIPDDVHADARELWQLVLRGTQANTARPDPIERIHMAFDVTARHEGGVNDVTIELSYRMREGWLRTDVPRSKRVQMRGPAGDYLIEEGVVTPLQGRENAQSRRDMDQWIAIARNFLSLTNPNAIRIVSMREVGAPSDRLPEEVRAKAGGLRWLEIESPDFHLFSTNGLEREPIFVARLGLRPETARVEYSLIQEKGRGRGDARLFAHTEFRELEGFQLPHNVLVYVVDVEDRGLAFFPRPSYDLYLRKNGQLNPELDESLFTP